MELRPEEFSLDILQKVVQSRKPSSEATHNQYFSNVKSLLQISMGQTICFPLRGVLDLLTILPTRDPLFLYIN